MGCLRPENHALLRGSQVVIGRRLAEARARRGWSQAFLGELLGAKQAYVAKVERGAEGLSLRKAVRFCEALGISIRDLEL